MGWAQAIQAVLWGLTAIGGMKVAKDVFTDTPDYKLKKQELEDTRYNKKSERELALKLFNSQESGLRDDKALALALRSGDRDYMTKMLETQHGYDEQSTLMNGIVNKISGEDQMTPAFLAAMNNFAYNMPAAPTVEPPPPGSLLATMGGM